MTFNFPKIFGSYAAILEKQQSSILSAAAIITAASIVSALSGLLRQRVLIGIFLETDQAGLAAYTVASALPDTVFQLVILGALSAAFIPIFSQYQKKSDAEAFQMTSSVMLALLLVFLLFSTGIFVFATPLTTALTGSHFTPQQIATASMLTRIMLGAQFFFAISNFFTGILQSYRRFIVPALAPIVYNIGILLGVFLFKNQFGIYSTGIGVVLGAFLHMLIQLPSVLKMGFRFSLPKQVLHPGLTSMARLTPPRVVTIGINQLQSLADNFFATSIAVGGEIAKLSVVMIGLAQQLMALPIRFFGVPIAQASLPFFVAEVEKNDTTHFRDLVVKSMHQVTFFAMPASVLLLILRVPIVRLAFGTKFFPWQATIITGRVVGIIALSIAAQAIVQVLIRAFYALKNTRTPFFITVVTVASYILLNLGFIFWAKWDVFGMGVATTLAAFIEAGCFLVLLNKEVPGITSKAFWWPQMKMLLAGFLMAVFLYLPFRILDQVVFDTSKTIELVLLTIITGTIGMLVYLYFALLLDIRELAILKDMLTKLDSWKKILPKSNEVLLESGSSDDEQSY